MWAKDVSPAYPSGNVSPGALPVAASFAHLSATSFPSSPASFFGFHSFHRFIQAGRPLPGYGGTLFPMTNHRMRFFWRPQLGRLFVSFVFISLVYVSSYGTSRRGECFIINLSERRQVGLRLLRQLSISTLGKRRLISTTAIINYCRELPSCII